MTKEDEHVFIDMLYIEDKDMDETGKIYIFDTLKKKKHFLLYSMSGCGWCEDVTFRNEIQKLINSYKKKDENKNKYESKENESKEYNENKNAFGMKKKNAEYPSVLDRECVFSFIKYDRSSNTFFKKTMNRFGVNGFPTIILKGESTDCSIYEGKRTFKDMRKALDNIDKKKENFTKK